MRSICECILPFRLKDICTNVFSSRIMDNLNGGIASSDRIDGLGKGIAEYLRSRYVDVPKKFLERGRI